MVLAKPVIINYLITTSTNRVIGVIGIIDITYTVIIRVIKAFTAYTSAITEAIMVVIDFDFSSCGFVGKDIKGFVSFSRVV